MNRLIPSLFIAATALITGCAEEDPEGILQFTRDGFEGSAITMKAFNDTDRLVSSIRCTVNGEFASMDLGDIAVVFDGSLEPGQDSSVQVDFGTTTPRSIRYRYDCTWMSGGLQRGSGAL